MYRTKNLRTVYGTGRNFIVWTKVQRNVSKFTNTHNKRYVRRPYSRARTVCFHMRRWVAASSSAPHLMGSYPSTRLLHSWPPHILGEARPFCGQCPTRLTEFTMAYYWRISSPHIIIRQNKYLINFNPSDKLAKMTSQIEDDELV